MSLPYFQASQKESSATAECAYPQSLPESEEASLPPSHCQGHIGNLKRAAAEHKTPSQDRRESHADSKVSSPCREDSSPDQDPSTCRKEPCPGRMSEDQTEAVRRAMRAVRLPESAVPDWARGLSDRQCEQRIGQMVARLTGER